MAVTRSKYVTDRNAARVEAARVRVKAVGMKAAGVKAAREKGEALWKILNPKYTTAFRVQWKSIVALMDASDKGVKENMMRTTWLKLATQFNVSFLHWVLELCFTNLANPPVAKQEKAESIGDQVFAVAEVTLDILDLLRSQFTGSPFEVEVQRYRFGHHLQAWRRYSTALVQLRENFSSLCVMLVASSREDSCKQRPAGAAMDQDCAVIMVAEKKRALQSSVLPRPQDVELSYGLRSVVCGTVTALIWCTGKSAPTASESYHELLSLPRQLEPWLMTLDADDAKSQKDTLYRGLYNCVSILVANPAHYGAQLTREFLILTLQNCAASSACKEYFKLMVARKLSQCLSSHGGNNIRIGLDVSEAAMKASYENTELQSSWADTDVLELVEGYVRLCQRSKHSVEGYAHLRDLIYHVRQLSPSVAAILGLYVIGLKFSSDVVDLDTACHDLLRDAAALMESCLQQAREEDRKYIFAVLIAFEMVKENSSKYIQGAWGSFVTARKAADIVDSYPASFNFILRRVLHLWYLLLRRSSDFAGLTPEEEFILKQGWNRALVPVVSLLRLSLMSLQGVQDCVTCIDYLLKRGSLQIDELRYLMASASNMGIQIYNNKDYGSAYYPLRVAYDVAWARVEATMQQTLSQPADNRVNDFMLDGCSKCMTLADSLKRSGKNQAGFEILSDGLLRWATVHSTLQPHPTNVPSLLVHVWVRALHTEGSAILKSDTQEHTCLYSFLKSRCQALHHRTIGLLLEEELLVLHELGDWGLDGIQMAKEQNLQSLCDNSSSDPLAVAVSSKTLKKVLERIPNSECTICYSLFSRERRRAILDPCGHSSGCYECATKAWKMKQNCPWCHARINMPICVPAKLFF